MVCVVTWSNTAAIENDGKTFGCIHVHLHCVHKIVQFP